MGKSTITYGIYRYEKAAPRKKRHVTVGAGRMVALLFVFGGAGVLLWVATPMLSWQLTVSKTRELISPLDVYGQKAKAIRPDIAGLVLAQSSVTEKPAEQGVAVKQLADGFSYFKPKKAVKNTTLKEFTVTINKLRVVDARVIVGSDEFDKNLGHLAGTALPGEVGNMFITGHSALPAFFSNSNYKTIFANLSKLDILDEVTVTVDKKVYIYSVEKSYVVAPDDVSVIDPPDPFGKYLTLMTCVPPGLNTKRLIVLARLVE